MNTVVDITLQATEPQKLTKKAVVHAIPDINKTFKATVFQTPNIGSMSMSDVTKLKIKYSLK